MQIHGCAGEPCHRCHSPTEADDLRCPVCCLPLPRPETDLGRAVARILRCDGCGAAMSYDVEVRAPRCAFCASVAHLEESEDPIEAADAYLPFRVAPDAAQQALRRWLGGLGFFRPSDLAGAATVQSLTPLWWVGWTFDVDAQVSWAADSNHGAGRAAWAPHAGQLSLALRASLVSASRGLDQRETARLARWFDLSTAQPAPHPMPGAAVERFDVQRSAARMIVARALHDQAVHSARREVPGSSVRNLHVEVMPRALRTSRYAFPTYVLAYRYHDRLYRALVHGQNAECAFGDAPLSLAKILLVAGAGALLLLLVLGALVLAST